MPACVYYNLLTEMFSKVITDWQVACLQIVYTVLYLKSTYKSTQLSLSDSAVNETLPGPYHFRCCINNSSLKPTRSLLVALGTNGIP